MRNITINITIDMLLDGYLTLVYYNSDGLQSTVSQWCSPNWEGRRYSSDFGREYYPIPAQTELTFTFPIQQGHKFVIDVEKSTIELGYTGSRDKWVGPGKLFQYPLSRYISKNIEVDG